jgi:hypothetical protein
VLPISKLSSQLPFKKDAGHLEQDSEMTTILDEALDTRSQ